MENASKALLIAAGVLIVILLVTFGIKILDSAQGTQDSATKVGESLSDKIGSGASSFLGLEEKIPETPAGYFDVDGSGGLSLSSAGKEAINKGELTKINIPSNIGAISIKDYTFINLTEITTIKMPDTITKIGRWAFSGCTSLKSIKLSNNTKEIKQDAFLGCSSLTKITIPSSVTTIGRETFQSCTSLNDINIPDSITYIGSFAFGNCVSLKEISLSKNMQSVTSYTFSECTALEKVVIPQETTKIGSGAFQGCSSLKSVTINKDATLGEYAFPTDTQINYY